MLVFCGRIKSKKTEYVTDDKSKKKSFLEGT